MVQMITKTHLHFLSFVKSLFLQPTVPVFAFFPDFSPTNGRYPHVVWGRSGVGYFCVCEREGESKKEAAKMGKVRALYPREDITVLTISTFELERTFLTIRQ